jgi:surface protein
MAFIFKVTTTSSPQTFTIPCQNVGTFNATVDWGDGGPTSSITAYNDADLAHSYATAGQYTITVTGTFPNIHFNNGGDRLLVDEVVDLGDVGWKALNQAFYGCSNMTAFDGGTADTSGVTNMYAMFLNCTSLTSLDLSGFDTASVTNMSFMFRSCSGLTSLDVSGFNTANVTIMQSIFNGCSSLTSLDVSGFNTASVTIMQGMFYGCSSLTSLDVSGFNTASVTNMSYIFDGCTNLTSLDVSSWDTSSVTNMQQMFFNCVNLTSVDVSSFNTASVTNMSFMFYSCSGLTSLDVSGFNTASVTTMSYMFFNCTNLTGLQISGFDVSSVTDGTNFLSGSNNALSTQEYNNTLRAWSQQSVQSGVTWHFGDATYDETHPDTGYYLDFDGLDDNMILPGTDFGSSTNATLYKTFRGNTGDTQQIMFGTNSTGTWILAAQSGSSSTTLSAAVGSPVYREDATIPSYADRAALFTALVDDTDHTIGIEEADLSANAAWVSGGFYIGGEHSTLFNSTGRLYAWAAVDTRLDGRNRDLLENFMISRKTA